MTSRLIVLTALLLVWTGCGAGEEAPGTDGSSGSKPVDHRTSFVGAYAGKMDIFVTVNGRATSGTFAASVSIGKSGADRLMLSGACALTARATSATSLTLDAKTCPASQRDNCTLSETVDEGTGTLSGSQLTITYSGSVLITCSDGSRASGTYRTTFTGSRQ